MSKNYSNKKSKQNSNQRNNYLPKNLVGGFIRGSVPLAVCGQNPLYNYNTQDIFNSCNGDCNLVKTGGSKKKVRKISKKANIYYRYT
jgi:hypothetical protein